MFSSFQSIPLRYLDQLIYPATLDDLMNINDTRISNSCIHLKQNDASHSKHTHTQQSSGVWVKYGPRACWHLRQLFVKMDVWAVDPESEGVMSGVNTTQQL